MNTSPKRSSVGSFVLSVTRLRGWAWWEFDSGFPSFHVIFSSDTHSPCGTICHEILTNAESMPLNLWNWELNKPIFSLKYLASATLL